MKKSELKAIIRECIEEELNEAKEFKFPSEGPFYLSKRTRIHKSKSGHHIASYGSKDEGNHEQYRYHPKTGEVHHRGYSGNGGYSPWYNLNKDERKDFGV